MGSTEMVVEVDEHGHGLLTAQERDEVLSHIDSLGSSQLSPLVPMLLGMVVGVAGALALLFASL